MKAFVAAMVVMAVIGVGSSLVLNNLTSWSSADSFASDSVRLN
ncbi:MAG: hypothetical protein ACR2OJ_04120 [Hyphomicrobiales bacterium]